VLFAAQSLWAGGEKEQKAADKEISFLTWNLPHYEDSIEGWMEDFEEKTGANAKWIDRKGSELATYFQTQLASNSAPDVVDIQSTLWYQYADDGILMKLNSYLQEEPAVKDRFQPEFFEAASNMGGDYYMLPLYTPSSLLFWNKPLLDEVGVPGPPETPEQLMQYSQQLAEAGHSGFMTLNFDWLYWPLFRSAGVQILNEDGTKAAFNTPAAEQVLTNLRRMTESGAIPGVAWTGRWSEPNGAFGAGGVGFHHAHTTALRAFMSESDWANADTVGIGTFPGGWSVPNYHGLGIVSTSENPDLAWEFLKVVTNDKWAENLVRTLGSLSGNEDADQAVLNDPEFAEENPLLVKMFETQLSDRIKLTGITGHPKDSEIKEAVYTNFQKAIFGETSPQEALDAAEQSVNNILAR
jgi:ABC-type glycerol-3-phosphate transport system substrate-binding protein